MNIQIKSEDEITLPDWISLTTLSFEEMGFIVLMSSLSHYPDSETLAKRFASEQASLIGISLKEKGVIEVSEDSEGGVAINVNLNAVFPEELDEADYA